MVGTSSSNEHSQRILLADGRRLGFAEYGDPEGKPVLHFHGYRGSRLEAALLHEQAAAMGLRLIGVDRPGMGLSDFQRGRSLPDWPADVVQLADALSLERFAIQAISGGGPYAAVCAYQIPERLTAVNMVVALGPRELGLEGISRQGRLTFALGRLGPNVLRALIWLLQGRFASRPVEEVEQIVLEQLTKRGRLPEPDRKVLENPGFVRHSIASTMESFRQGSEGAAHDGALYARSWGFTLDQIAYKPIHLWYGDLDQHVPATMGRKMHAALPNSRLTVYLQDGHLSTVANHQREFMGVLS